ncbi:hypothetical protein FF011L_19500 [Roseimaritima multifibrata]|uniref:Amine oxidase domain-containing protein n=1 Tax=Roseimaritima multifibrata TaxID=1930274 RepID=A0A517ME75_9BACT|nr:NAD(P)/FAD-dependent oxidoreductase [Roseimaritima multifibrata]QDS93189.1 hypothetical protein FF011L_19500 [Roseimaritima multifibrata]
MTQTSNPSDSTAPAHWLVVGGGMMGLSVAQQLAKRHQKVTICEAAPQFGGLTSAWNLNDVVWDRFYHVTLLSDTRLRELLTEIGLEKEIRWVETKTGFYAGGKLYSMSNTMEFLRFPPLNLIEKLRLGGTIWLASKIKNWQRLEKIPVADWLQKWSGKGTFQKIWLPLLRAKLGETYKQASAAFIWAHISRMYKARRSGMKVEMFGYVPGGYARILDELGKSLQDQGVEMQADSPVQDVHRQPDGKISVTFKDGRQESYDNVLFTIPSPLIAKVCPQLDPHQKKQHENIQYMGVVCTSLLLKKPISPYYVTNITDDVPMTAVIEMSTIVDPEKELGGHSLVYLPKYLPQDSPGLQEPDDVIEERFLSTLEGMYDHFSRDQVAAVRTSRAKYVMALPTLNYSKNLPPVVTSVPGLYALNAAHIVKGNLNVNETIELGDEKLNEEVWPDFLARSTK